MASPNSERKAKIVGTIGAIANWSIPVTAILSILAHSDPSTINTNLTAILIGYSGLFLRWSVAIRPANYPLFACHLTNIAAQSWQLYRALTYNTDSSATQRSKLPSVVSPPNTPPRPST